MRVQYDSVSVPVHFAVPHHVRHRWRSLCLWRVEGLVDVMIRLYLKAYSERDLTDLYNTLSVARSAVPMTDVRVLHDLDEALLYITGYADALRERGYKK